MNTQNNSTQPEITISERLALVTIFSIAAAIIFITQFSNRNNSKEIHRLSLDRHLLEVFVKGDVAYPGIYRLPSEMTLRDILDIAQVQPTADLRRYNLNKLVRRGQLIKIPKKETVQIHITGAVKRSETLMLPKGTSLQEVIPLIAHQALPNANLEALKRKRKLKDGETIEIKRQR